ncbi:hypothetical protein [Caudoviricetes sp.]|nr:hypothetical protein [Caudoviricetes sp.]
MTDYLAMPYDTDGDLFYFDDQNDFYRKAEENRQHGIKANPNEYQIRHGETDKHIDFESIPKGD